MSWDFGIIGHDCEHETQGSFEFVLTPQLVPKDHLLWKIEKAINFEFIREKTRGLYCPDNGRPAIGPALLFKLVFIGYLYGIRSERQLVREAEGYNAYRWFIGFKLLEPIPNASTFSQNRRRRFNGSSIYQEIFDEIVLQAARLGLVDGKVLHIDSTQMKVRLLRKANILCRYSSLVACEPKRTAYSPMGIDANYPGQPNIHAV